MNDVTLSVCIGGVDVAGGRWVSQIASDVAARVVVAYHYLHRRPPISYAYALQRGGEVVGVVTFGFPASRHAQMSACATNPNKVIELNRLWVSDDEPRNSETVLLGAALRLLPPFIVISYADTAHGHQGYVYRAANFRYAGWSDMDRKTPRFDRVPIDGSHSRNAYRIGHDGTRVPRKPKVRYWTVSGDRRQRRELAAMVTWPSFDWRKLPPPKGAPDEV